MSSPEIDLLLQLAGLQADASQYRAEFEKISRKNAETGFKRGR